MNIHILAAEGGMVGNPVANIGIFLLFVAVTLFIVIRASKKNATAAEFFTAGRSFTGPQNGIAISGDYLSAASFLGIAGAIAVYGYDGLPLLDRVPGRVAGCVAPRCRITAQRR